MVTTGDFGSEGRRFESWCRQANFLLYIGDLNSCIQLAWWNFALGNKILIEVTKLGRGEHFYRFPIN